MRALASLTVAAALALGAAPADAVKKTQKVPFLGCHVTVQTMDGFVGFDPSRSGAPVRYEVWGDNDVKQNCV